MTLSEKIELRFRNVELERQVLAYAVKKDPTALTYVDPVWFSVQLHSDLCRMLKQVKVTMSSVLLLQEARRTKIIVPKHEKTAVAILSKIENEAVSHVTKQGAALMVRQLAELYDSSRIAMGMRDLTKAMSNGWDLAEARALLKELSRATNAGSSESGGDYVEDFEERIEIVRERAQKDEAGSRLVVPTGITHFDRWLSGGLLKSDGEFGIILGETGVGKSATLVSFGAYAFAADFNVVYCSGEMSKTSVGFRTDAHFSMIPARAFREGALTEEQWKRWHKTIQLLRSTRSNYFEILTFPRKFTMENVEERILEVEDKHGAAVDLVLLDYINILEPKAGPRGEWRSQADVVWDFKGFLKEHNGGTVGWAPGQITDDAIGKEILGVEDAKYARAISETAPIIVGLVQTDEDMLSGQLQFQTIKLRESKYKNQVVYLHPNLDIMRINDALEERSLRTDRKQTADLTEVRELKRKKKHK